LTLAKVRGHADDDERKTSSGEDQE
jgi:hypothetical protein